ncbi:MAG: type I glyceraldehyde-3-phosphate dehydrogenase [Chloroflexi bacterium]|jgi:glyceraldehyde 3-phosphate dehydrogenase|nr:type I glyceraldehyde-3-phosphate dehydrogenase [Chloroflexota bacterium]MBT7080747.1 type I glyceraldehyde-3-phosphate dehydrogenase [Chloroflexota bacterium]
MTTKIGVNGFGRIGRQVTKAIVENYKGKLEVVVVNDLTDTKTNAHLFKYDSNYGIFDGTVDYTDDAVVINGAAVKVIAERDPGKIAWGDYGVDIVIESTGLFTEASKAAGHMNGGAKKVLISAPAKGEDLTVVLGVNENEYDPAKHNIISNASCTTNCIAPVVKVLNDNFGVSKALMSTIHAYTNDQKILDQAHKDLRRARTAAMNIIPTTTGAAKAVTQVIPALVGKIHGMAYRVPTSTVSVVDLVADLDKDVTVEDVNNALKAAANGEFKGILEYCDEPLVSIDFKGNPASSIVDSLSTMVIAGNMIKVLSWYDNEWGYSNRMADLAAFIADKGL